jgi:hypothetical protein
VIGASIRAMSRFAWPLIAVLGACASSSAPAVQSPSAALAAKPAVTPVPAEPLELLVANPDAVVVLQVEALRASPVFPRLRPYIERSTCIASADLDWLLQATKRAISASRSTQSGELWLALLDGKYAPSDAARVLAQAVARRGEPAAPAAHEARGRFEVSVQGELAASVLDERVLLLGAADWVRAAIDAVEHPATAFAVSPLWRELGPKVRCGERPVCAFALGHGAAADRLGGALSQLGSRDLARAFTESDSAASLALPSGVDVSLAVQLNSAEVAEAAAAQVKSWLWQASLLTRLAGLPDVLSSAQLRAEGTLFAGELSASADDLAAYEARAAKLLEPAANSCNAGVAAR